MKNRTCLLAAVAASAALSLMVIATATAQDRPATPDTSRVESRYTLVEVAGKALPVETEKGWRCREEVTAGTLVLREDNHWGLETSMRETCGERTKMDHEDEHGIYRTEGTTIHFLDDDGDRSDADWSLEREIDLEDLDQGSYADDGTLSVRLADEETVLRFRGQAR